MYSRISVAVMVFAAGLSTAVADETSDFSNRTAQQSYAIGLQTGRNLKRDKVDLDLEMLARGFRDALDTNAKPLLSDKELKMIMARVQQDARKTMIMNRRERSEKAREEGPKFLADHAQRPGVQVTPSGLQYSVVKQGRGPKPALSDTVQVRYRGTLLSGFEFDASPADQVAHLHVAQLPPGLKEALQAMPVGSHWSLVLPANLGYGDRGLDQDVGPNEVLQFDLELVAIDPPKDKE